MPTLKKDKQEKKGTKPTKKTSPFKEFALFEKDTLRKKFKKLFRMKMSKCKLRISLSLKNNQILKELINHILLIKKNSKLFS